MSPRRHGTGDTYTCAFTVLVAQLDTELEHEDTVLVTVHDNDGNTGEVGADETVTFDLSRRLSNSRNRTSPR